MENIKAVQESFSVQAEGFESKQMNFSKQEYLDYSVREIGAAKTDRVLEVAAGTCICGRNLAPLVNSVVCLDATPAMLKIGRDRAEKERLTNMQFVQGYAEAIPYPDETYDITLSRLSFHHFSEISAPFAEMNRVLKPGGKLVLIDMEAAEEDLRDTEDRIEAMRDPSHVRNASRSEFLALFQRHGCKLVKAEGTGIPVELSAWMELTKTPGDIRQEIISMMEEDLAGGTKTGFRPYRKDGTIWFDQRWLLMLGIKGVAASADADCAWKERM